MEAHKRVNAAVFGVLTAVMLSAPGAALAQTPTNDVYDPVDARKQQAAEHASSGLAFTGLDVWIVALAGVLILITGILIRRAARAD